MCLGQTSVLEQTLLSMLLWRSEHLCICTYFERYEFINFRSQQGCQLESSYNIFLQSQNCTLMYVWWSQKTYQMWMCLSSLKKRGGGRFDQNQFFLQIMYISNISFSHNDMEMFYLGLISNHPVLIQFKSSMWGGWFIYLFILKAYSFCKTISQ